MATDIPYDVIIVGSGPAGLNAALILGRCRRSVVILNDGRPRNAAARQMHGYLTRDGFEPMRFLRLGRQEIRKYGVRLRKTRAVKARRLAQGFEVIAQDGECYRSRKLLLATGMRDELPDIAGLRPLYGKSVHHCPYCDGWEWRDQRLVAFGHGKAGIGLALALKRWSDSVVICFDGQADLRPRYRKLILEHSIDMRASKIKRLEGHNGLMKRIHFEHDAPLACDAMFFNTGQHQKTPLAAMLGCEFDAKGGVVTDKRERTCIPGLYLAGDASREVQFVICAAAAGATAAIAINRELQAEEGRTL